MTLKIIVHSKKNERYAQEIIAGRHRMTADLKESHGVSSSGPGPYSFLLAALST